MIQFHTISKIESQMIAAINSRKNWKSDNTEVLINDENLSLVYLHDDLIAWVNDDNELTIFEDGEDTSESRLDALCVSFDLIDQWSGCKPILDWNVLTRKPMPTIAEIFNS